VKLVLDTNIIVSAFINPNGKPSQVLKMVLNRKAKIYYNTYILCEYETVMLRPKFSSKISTSNINRFIDIIRSIGISYDPIPSKIKLPDESDRIFYDTAKESGSILVSGNITHFPKESFILTAADLLKIVENKSAF